MSEAQRKQSCRMLKKARLLTRPTLARRDAPCPRQGRSSPAEPRFTFHVSPFTVLESNARTPLADFFSILLQRKCELGQLSLVETLLHQRANIEHSFDLLNVIESGFRAGVRRGEE